VGEADRRVHLRLGQLPRRHPRLLGLYRDGLLDLDSMVTVTYPLEGINQGYQDLRDGKNIRGVLVM
jgi:Zn-dependent alcohol dehydrogenase